jgi:hypothetical protein
MSLSRSVSLPGISNYEVRLSSTGPDRSRRQAACRSLPTVQFSRTRARSTRSSSPAHWTAPRPIQAPPALMAEATSAADPPAWVAVCTGAFPWRLTSSMRALKATTTRISSFGNGIDLSVHEGRPQTAAYNCQQSAIVATGRRSANRGQEASRCGAAGNWVDHYGVT